MVHSRGSNAALKKVELGYRTNPHATQAVDRLPQRCQNRKRGWPEGAFSIESAHSAKNDVEGLPYVDSNPLQLSMDSREGSIVYLSQRFAFVNCVVDVCS